MEMTLVPTQLVQYDCDTVEVSYPDGGVLQLSPCGACFTYCQPETDDSHPAYGDRIIQQRTPYTISTFRDKVQLALEFRNKFATRPYVCKEVIHPESLVKLPNDLVEFQWPSEVRSTDIFMLDDGSLQMTAAHQHAVVILAACQQLLTVRYLCKVGRVVQQRKMKVMSKHSESQAGKSENRACNTSGSSAANSSSHGSELVQSEETILNEGLWDYAWLMQQFSVLSVPECWQYPCQALMHFAKKNKNSVHFEDQEPRSPGQDRKHGENDDARTYVSTLIPQALALNCSSVNLHKWRHREGDDVSGAGRLKVTSSQGVIYRVVDMSGVCVEIYPGDGSVMRSQGLAGHYFIHYVYKCGKVEERIHSVLHPPPDTPESQYSISKLIRRGSRLLQHVCDQNINLVRQPSPVCWQVDVSQSTFREPLSSVVLEQCTVSGVGKFTAHSSGRIHIVFEDRTTLDMITDWPSRIRQYLKHTDGNDEVVDLQYYNNQFIPARCSDLPKNTCRLLLPSGHYQYVNLTAPGEYQRYVQAAMEWVNWVNTSSADRPSFYKDTVHDEGKLNSVQEEMRKIRCFNYIIENTVLSQFSHIGDKASGEYDASKLTEDASLDVVSKTYLQHLTSSDPVDKMANMAAKMSSVTRRLSAKSAAKTGSGNSLFGSKAVEQSALDENKRRSEDTKTELSYDIVQEVLLKTSEKIKELDSFLSNQRSSALTNT